MYSSFLLALFARPHLLRERTKVRDTTIKIEYEKIIEKKKNESNLVSARYKLYRAKQTKMCMHTVLWIEKTGISSRAHKNANYIISAHINISTHPDDEFDTGQALDYYTSDL